MHCYSVGIAFGGDYTPDEIYNNYICDEVDNQTADVTTIMCIYAAGMTHDAYGNAVDVVEPVLLPSERDPHYTTHFLHSFLLEHQNILLQVSV